MASSERHQQPLRSWLKEQPFTLTMSSGFFGFFAHLGVLTALREAELAPTAVTGASAGGLVIGLWAAGVEPDVLRGELLALKRADFWDPSPGLGLLRGRLFEQKLRALTPAARLEACRVPVRISVFDVFKRRTEILSEGDLALVIRATCAVPGFFQPVWIGSRPKLDGGILDRPGLQGTAPNERVFYHHLISTSPWRSRRSPAAQAAALATRPNLRTLVVPDLPRVTPFNMQVNFPGETIGFGQLAFVKALTAARRVLGV